MEDKALKRYFLFILSALAVCFLGKFLISLFFPFLLGFLIARISEPMTAFLGKKLPRYMGSFLGVLMTLIMIFTILSVLGAIAIRELGRLTDAIPGITDSLTQGIQALQDRLIRMTDFFPEKVRPMMISWVLELLGDSSHLLTELTRQIPGLLGSVLETLPDGALTLGTGILAGFLISSRLPKIRELLRSRLPESWQEKYIPLWEKGKKAVKSWFTAQGKLAFLTFLLLCLGFFLMKIPGAPVWAALGALVDAVPMLGTGTLLIPWALLELLQGKNSLALGLLGLYGAAFLLRTILEPRLLGKQLGLDPLITLIFMYLGYQLWGLWGMILFPMTAGAVRSAMT